MSISKTAQIGIISCPGGKSFANDVATHIRRLYKLNIERKVAELMKRYGFQKNEAIERLNLAQELFLNQKVAKTPIDRYVPPQINVPTEFTHFANGEFKANILSSVRGMDLYIFQDVENHEPLEFSNSEEKFPLSVNDHMMSLFTVIDAAQQSGARTITLVLPVYPYSRQDRRKGREALSAAWFARTCEYMGVDKIITLDIHSTEIANACKTMCIENLHASYQIMKKLSGIIDMNDNEATVIVSPDTGAVDRNKFYAGNLNMPLAMLYKERDYSKVTTSAATTNIISTRLLGDVKGKNVFMADDMLGTGGTLIKAMKKLKEFGAKDIVCGISLPLFTGNAIEAFDEAYKQGLFTKIIGTNAVYHDERLLGKEWYISASVSELFAHFIMRLHYSKSTSPLLDNIKIIQKFLKPKDAE